MSNNDYNSGNADWASGEKEAFSSLEGTQAIVCGLWKVALDLPEVGLDEHILSFGVTSLLLAQLLSRINQTFEVQMPASALLEHATIRSMAEWLHYAASNTTAKF